MVQAPPGLEIVETRHEGPVRVIYSARQLPLGRQVQLVGLAPGVLSSSPLARALEHEAEVLSLLDHPNILRLFDLKRDDSDLWLVLEEVGGPFLIELVEKELSWQAVAAIGLDLARALIHAHSVGEAHGRLHLGAVQLTLKGRTKLSGFGQRPKPQDEQVEALEPQTPGGLSPEATVGQAVGPLSDLFAWGALMYELLCGETPFGDPNDTRYASRVRNDRPKPLLLRRPDLPAALDHLITQCLEKLPSERPAHAAELAEQLETLVGSATLPILRSELVRQGKIPATGTEIELQTQGDRHSLVEGAAPLLRRFLAPISAAVIGALGAGAAVYGMTRSGPDATPSAVTARPLPTEKSLLLRVVASPWAHVLVDGEHRETTPFARPIHLPPGKHIVRLEHPQAPPEERVVEGRAGQAVLLNVQMHVEKPLQLDAPVPVPEENSP